MWNRLSSFKLFLFSFFFILLFFLFGSLNLVFPIMRIFTFLTWWTLKHTFILLSCLKSIFTNKISLKYKNYPHYLPLDNHFGNNKLNHDKHHVLFTIPIKLPTFSNSFNLTSTLIHPVSLFIHAQVTPFNVHWRKVAREVKL